MRVQRYLFPLSPALASRWDDFVQASPTGTLFQSSGWLGAAYTNYARADPSALLVVNQGDAWLAGVALTRRPHHIEFLGTGPSDYMDVLFCPELGEETQKQALDQLLYAAQAHWPSLPFVLRNVRAPRSTLATLQHLPGWHISPLRETPAPALDMDQAPKKILNSKSQRRNWRMLAKQGDLQTHYSQDATWIAAHLEDLFNLHIARWAPTPTPSMFLHTKHKAFFRAWVHALGPTGALRWTSMTLDNALVAAHLGLQDKKRTLWYKPSYSLDFSKASPGTLLMREAVAQAQREGAQVFDMTIGGEGYKGRFATHSVQVMDIHLTRNLGSALRVRAWRKARRQGRLAFNALKKHWEG